MRYSHFILVKPATA